MIANYTVTVKFGCTQSVGNYSNVRPEFEMSLSGQGDFEEASTLAEKLMRDVRQSVQEIVDEELELRNQDLLYYDGTTFSLVAPKDFCYLAIVPDSQPLPKLWADCVPYRMRHKRLDHLRWLIKDKYKDDSAYDDKHVQIVDVQDLPPLERFTEMRLTIEGVSYLVLLSGDRRYVGAGDSLLSCPPQKYYTWSGHCGRLLVMDKERFLGSMAVIAEKNGYTLIDCLDNDFSRLPALPEPEPEEEEEDIPFEDEDEDEDEEDERDPGF